MSLGLTAGGIAAECIQEQRPPGEDQFHCNQSTYEPGCGFRPAEDDHEAQDQRDDHVEQPPPAGRQGTGLKPDGSLKYGGNNQAPPDDERGDSQGNIGVPEQKPAGDAVQDGR